MLEICGEKIILREFSEENLTDPLYYKWLRDLDILCNIYRIEYLLPLKFKTIESYVNNLLCSETDCFFAIYLKEKEEFIGTQRIGHINWRVGLADLGILIGNKNYWGQGLATDVIRTACLYSFEKLSLRKLTAGTSANNTAMIKCFERIGFSVEGVLRKQLLLNGDYYDHYLFGIFKDEFLSKLKK